VVLPLRPLSSILQHDALRRQAVADLVGQSVLLGLAQLGAGAQQQINEGGRR
jgi:hypothetical protein